MQEKKYRVLNRAPKPGDLIRLTDEAPYSFDQAGDIKRVVRLGEPPGVVWVRGNTPGEWNYSPDEYEVVGEILPGGFKVGDRVRIKSAPVSTFAPLLYGGQTGTLKCYDGTDRCPWRVQLDKLHNCIWVGTEELEPLPQPEYDPDDVKLTSPAEPDEDDESGCTVKVGYGRVDNPAAWDFLRIVQDHLQEVTFTADGDIIAKFK